MGSWAPRKLGWWPRGREFSVSGVYKLMEAMAWEIGRTSDEHLEERFRWQAGSAIAGAVAAAVRN